MQQNIHIQIKDTSLVINKRLDLALSILLPDYSRATIQSWIKNGYIIIDKTTITNQRFKLTQAKHKIEINALITDKNTINEPQEINLDIIYQDDDVILINKPVGLTVHPGAGCHEGTLLNALLFHFPELNQVPRAGIVHRLDKDTSGILIIGRNIISHKKLVEALQQRLVKREYLAIVYGNLISGGTINAPIGRHKIKRTHMAVVDNGRHAVTHYKIKERFKNMTYIDVELDTGRTHQIRVHMTHIKHPLVGDMIYNNKVKLPIGASEELKQFLYKFKRQALHAYRLTFYHPTTNKQMQFEATIPKDIKQLLKLLK